MADENQKEAGELVVTERKVVHSGDAPRYYTNNTEIAMTSFDLHIKFALIESSDDESLYVKDQAIISMSLHHAKAIAGILVAYVKQFERQHGPLFVPSMEETEIPHDTVKVKVDSNS
jgi:uncharacterized protein DUF3467